MTTVLIVGGNGAVGREAARALAAQPDIRVIAAGRRADPAPSAPGIGHRQVDVSDPASLARGLVGVDAVLMCVDVENHHVAQSCLQRGIHYVDVTASHDAVAALESLAEAAARRGVTIAMSVGLAPGVSNLLAAACTRGARDVSVQTGVLLGMGEAHGPAAVSWTLDGLGELKGSWRMQFPPPYGVRTVHRFPFSDQFTLPSTLGVASARTGLCLDSRPATQLLSVGARRPVLRLLRRPAVRELLLRGLEAVHVGDDGFAVAVAAGHVRASFSGRGQSRATGRAAALLVRRLPGLARGAAHIEQLVEPRAFLAELAADGFDLRLPPEVAASSMTA